jgi:hypothetical protein
MTVRDSGRDDFVRGLNATDDSSTRKREHVACRLGKPGQDNGLRLYFRYGVSPADDFVVSIWSLKTRAVEKRQVGAPLCDEGGYLGEQQCVVAYNYQWCEARWRHRRVIASAGEKRVRRTKQMAGN